MMPEPLGNIYHSNHYIPPLASSKNRLKHCLKVQHPKSFFETQGDLLVAPESIDLNANYTLLTYKGSDYTLPFEERAMGA